MRCLQLYRLILGANLYQLPNGVSAPTRPSSQVTTAYYQSLGLGSPPSATPPIFPTASVSQPPSAVGPPAGYLSAPSFQNSEPIGPNQLSAANYNAKNQLALPAQGYYSTDSQSPAAGDSENDPYAAPPTTPGYSPQRYYKPLSLGAGKGLYSKLNSLDLQFQLQNKRITLGAGVTSVWTTWSTWSLCRDNSQVRVRGCYTYQGFQCSGPRTQERACDNISGNPLLDQSAGQGSYAAGRLLAQK